MVINLPLNSSHEGRATYLYFKHSVKGLPRSKGSLPHARDRAVFTLCSWEVLGPGHRQPRPPLPLLLSGASRGLRPFHTVVFSNCSLFLQSLTARNRAWHSTCPITVTEGALGTVILKEKLYFFGTCQSSTFYNTTSFDPFFKIQGHHALEHWVMWLSPSQPPVGSGHPGVSATASPMCVTAFSLSLYNQRKMLI